MNVHQWEIWKSKPVAFQKDHWFVVISNQERLNNPKYTQINGLACFTLRGDPLKSDVRLNHADGFAGPTVCQCDLIYFLDKSPSTPLSGQLPGNDSNSLRRDLKKFFACNN
jgi:hypothetical protein